MLLLVLYLSVGRTAAHNSPQAGNLSLLASRREAMKSDYTSRHLCKYNLNVYTRSIYTQDLNSSVILPLVKYQTTNLNKELHKPTFGSDVYDVKWLGMNR